MGMQISVQERMRANETGSCPVLCIMRMHDKMLHVSDKQHGICRVCDSPLYVLLSHLQASEFVDWTIELVIRSQRTSISLSVLTSIADKQLCARKIDPEGNPAALEVFKKASPRRTTATRLLEENLNWIGGDMSPTCGTGSEDNSRGSVLQKRKNVRALY